MTTIFRNRFPRAPWKASDYASPHEPAKYFVDSEHTSDFAASHLHIGSSFADPAVNQGRPSPTAWAVSDALIASLFVATVAWVCLGCPS